MLPTSANSWPFSRSQTTAGLRRSFGLAYADGIAVSPVPQLAPREGPSRRLAEQHAVAVWLASSPQDASRTDFEEVHDVTEIVKERIRAAFLRVIITVHTEPATPSPPPDDLTSSVEHAMSSTDDVVSPMENAASSMDGALSSEDDVQTSTDDVAASVDDVPSEKLQPRSSKEDMLSSEDDFDDQTHLHVSDVQRFGAIFYRLRWIRRTTYPKRARLRRTPSACDVSASPAG